MRRAAFVVLTGLTLLGVVAWWTLGRPSDATAVSATSGGAGPTGTCDAVEHPLLQSGLHLLGDQEPPVAYSSTPPTSGWHAAGRLTVDVRPHDRPLSEPQQVSVLEAGGVVVTYGGPADAEIARLADEIGERYDGRVALTAYDALDEGAVAFTAWGSLQRCDGVDSAALARFVDTFGSAEPVTTGHEQ